MLEAVKQWAFILVVTAFIGTLANSFVISDNGSMKKYVKFACAIVALAVMIMPIKEIFSEVPGLFDLDTNAFIEFYEYNENTDILNELALIKTNELLKDRIYDIVCEKTGIKPDDVRIYIKQTDNKDEQTKTEIEIEKIVINIYDINDNKIEETKLYLENLFNCGVYIEYIETEEKKINE